MIQEARALKTLLLLNLKEFFKVEFNLEFDETSAIEFLTPSITIKLYLQRYSKFGFRKPFKWRGMIT